VINSQRIAATSGAVLALIAASTVTVTDGRSGLTAEKQVIQGAFDMMLADQQVPPSRLTGCESNPMHAQPGSSDPNWTDQMTRFPPGGAVYATPTPGRIGVVTVLGTHYIRATVTALARYICDQEGNIYQLAK